MQAQLKDITQAYDRKTAEMDGGTLNVPCWHMQLILQEVAQTSLLRQRVALADLEMQAIENHMRATDQPAVADLIAAARQRVKGNVWTMDQLQKQIISQRATQRGS